MSELDKKTDDIAASTSTNKQSWIKEGEHCWAIEKAKHVSFIVDAAAYFETLQKVIPKAKSTLFIIGWDIHSQLCMNPDAEKEEQQIRLIELLDQACEKNPSLKVRILIWNPAPIYAFEREFFSKLQFKFRSNKNIHFEFASDHPVGATHHQKLVVVDDQIAFIGGIDLSVARWDTREHVLDDPCRKMPSGESYDPFHDVQMALDGKAAQRLAQLVRDRWERTTKEKVPFCESQNQDLMQDAWEKVLTVHAENVSVAISRTQPAFQNISNKAFEIEAVCLGLIQRAESFIYLENQYLTSRKLCAAFEESLKRSLGPEIVIISPYHQSGRLEEATMGTLRVQFVKRLKDADKHGRLRLLCPKVGDDTYVNVHAKVWVVDQQYLQVGSANLSERSLYLDTECVATVIAGNPMHQASIQQFRDGLIAEHLGIEENAIQSKLQETGSLIQTIDHFREDENKGIKTLVPLEIQKGDFVEDLVASNPDWIDPNAGLKEVLAENVLPKKAHQFSGKKVALAGFLIALIATLWVLQSFVFEISVEELMAKVSAVTDYSAAPAIGVLGFIVLAFCMVPVTVLIVVSSLLFGPWIGALVSGVSVIISAVAGFFLGKYTFHELLKSFFDNKLHKIKKFLSQKGTLSIVGVRIVPVAPYMVVNLAVGSMPVRFRDYIVGTVWGMAPGLVLLSFASNEVKEIFENPSVENILWAVGSVLAFILVSIGISKFFNAKFFKNEEKLSNET